MLALIGWSPILKMRPMPPPIGTVQRLLSLASQLAVMRGLEVKYQPLGGYN